MCLNCDVCQLIGNESVTNVCYVCQLIGNESVTNVCYVCQLIGNESVTNVYYVCQLRGNESMCNNNNEDFYSIHVNCYGLPVIATFFGGFGSATAY